jgi:hypothetical protein
MDIRDEAALDLCSRLDELEEVCRPGGPANKKCKSLCADVTRKAAALKGSILRLKQALHEAGPPPVLARETRPLYERLAEQPALGEIARLVGHYGIHEDEVYALTRQLSGQHGADRVSCAMIELTWVDPRTRWVKLRPEVIRACRPVVGPLPGAEDYERWWQDRGGPPVPRSAEFERQGPRAPVDAKAERKPRTRKKTA